MSVILPDYFLSISWSLELNLFRNILNERLLYYCSVNIINSTQSSLVFIICASQESLDLATPQSQDASLLLPPSCSSPLLSSPVEEHPQTDGPLTEKMDTHLLKKMAFRWVTMKTSVSQDRPQFESPSTWWVGSVQCRSSYSLFFLHYSFLSSLLPFFFFCFPGSLCLLEGWSQEVWASASWCCGLDLLDWGTPPPGLVLKHPWQRCCSMEAKGT